MIRRATEITVAGLLFLTMCCTTQTQAMGIVRDDETENIIREIIDPLVRSANIDPKKIELYIINDDSVNAFTAGGHSIFIFQGLLKLSNDPDLLAGVIAHEMGHVVLGHVAREDDKINDALDPISSISLGILSGIAAVLAKDPRLLSMPLATAQDSYLKYTRIQESSADAMAVNILHNTNISADGLISALSFFQKKENMMIDNYRTAYQYTHPFSRDRLDYLRSAEHTRAVQESSVIGSPEQRQRFSVAVDKFRAYTEPTDLIIRNFGHLDTFNAKYAMAIALMRKNELTKAENAIDELIIAAPENPYLFEVRSQIYNASGKDSLAIADLQRADELLSSTGMTAIKLSLINQKLKSDIDSIELKKIIGELRQEVVLSPNNMAVIYTLAQAYSASNQPAMSHLALSQMFLIGRNPKQARAHLNIAKQHGCVLANAEALERDISKLERKNKRDQHFTSNK